MEFDEIPGYFRVLKMEPPETMKKQINQKFETLEFDSFETNDLIQIFKGLIEQKTSALERIETELACRASTLSND
jgi:hypothetical protein